MGFMDKARKLAEQAQQKLDEGQDQLNAAQPGAPSEPSAASVPAPPSGLRDVDRSHEAPPALTSGDPLAG